MERLGRVLAHPIDAALAARRGLGVRGRGAARRARPVLAAEAGAAEPALAARAAARACSVLAIDNEPRVLEGMRLLLQKWGCRVATAHGLADGARRRSQSVPDVIIADYHLDDGDGLAAIAALRERFGFATPAILATADRSPEVRDAAAAADVALLNKPLKPAPLRALLSRCLSQRADAAE